MHRAGHLVKFGRGWKIEKIKAKNEESREIGRSEICWGGRTYMLDAFRLCLDLATVQGQVFFYMRAVRIHLTVLFVAGMTLWTQRPDLWLALTT